MQVKKDQLATKKLQITQPNVFLTITIGNRQIGGNQLQFDGNPNIFAKGDISNLNLGSAADLGGKTLTIITNVLDANDSSQGIVVTFSFHGTNAAPIQYTNTVDNNGDILSLTTKYSFL
ncbi:MAG: hypothetical protein P4L41_13130 [Flavipsychrobacter sp.]|nr:hypothetical protein [Flavipsychrobacter sp.]